MKIEVNKIPDGQSLDFEGDYDPKTLDLQVQGLGEFIGPIHIWVHASKTEPKLFVNVNVNAKMKLVCSRCLEEFVSEISQALDFDYDINGKASVDITDDIRQELLLDFPIKALCKSGCKGICPQCGKNLNEGVCGHGTT